MNIWENLWYFSQDRSLHSGWKLAWLLLLVFLPFVTVLMVLMARVLGLTDRSKRRPLDNGGVPQAQRG